MAATGAPADEAIKATQHLIDTTLDEVEKILLRLPPRRITTTTSVVRTTESLATMTAVSPAITTAVSPATTTAMSPTTTTAHSSQLAPAHSSEVKITKQQSQSTSSSTITAMTPDAKTAVSPPTKAETSPVAKTADSSREQHNRSGSTSLITAVSPDAKTAMSPPTKTATSPVAKTMARSTREQHNRSDSTSLITAVSPDAKTAVSPPTKAETSPMAETAEQHYRSESTSLTTAVSPIAKTATSPMARTARSSGQRQRSHSASSAISQPFASTSTGDVRTAITPSVCPNTAPPKPKSFVIPQPRTSTPIHHQIVQSSSSVSVHTPQPTSGNSTAVSPIAKTAHSPMAKTAQSPMARTAHSTAMASETSGFVLQGPVTVSSQETVTKRQDGLVNVTELIELRGAGATGMPTNELQPRAYSRAAPTSAKGAVDSKETVKVGDNVMHIQRSIAINPAGPPSTQLSEYALKELRIYSQDGTAHKPTTSNSPAQLVRLRSEQEGGGIDIELNINVKRNKGASTTPAKIKCDCPGFIPNKVWVNGRQVWTAAGN